jgi:uncharacterized protein (DUF849 family)
MALRKGKMTILSLNRENIAAMTDRDVAQLAERLEKDDYNNPFEALQDWHLLRAIAFQRQELVEPYLYLLDIETFDEA